MDGTLEESEITFCGLLDRKDTDAVRRLTRKNPGIHCTAITQNKVSNAVYPFELANPVDAQPLVVTEEVGGTYPIHQGHVANTD